MAGGLALAAIISGVAGALGLGGGNTSAASSAVAASPSEGDPVLADLAHGVIVPNMRAFGSSAALLSSAADAFARDPSESRLATLQTAWRAARVDWKRAEPSLVGPEDGAFVSGEIDTFPVDERGIETIIAGELALSADLVESLGARQKGFLAIEYLIFDEDGGSKESLGALTTGSQADRRRAYVAALSQAIASIAHGLREAWTPEGERYVQRFTRPGTSDAPYPDAQAAIDAVIQRMVTAVEHMKDDGLRMPLGSIRERHPELIACRRSDHAIEDLVAGIEGVRHLYEGRGSRAGLGRRVRRASEELDASIRFSLRRTPESLRAIPGPLDRAVVEHPEAVTAAGNVMRNLRDRLGTHLVVAYDSNLTFGGFDGD